MKDTLIALLTVIAILCFIVLGLTTVGFIGMSIYYWAHDLTLAAALWEAFSTSAIIAVVALATATIAVITVKVIE